MGDIAVFEAAQDIDDGIDFADVGEELIAKPLAFACTADQSGDIDEFELGGDDGGRTGDGGELVDTIIRHGNAADIRLNGAEGIVRGFRLRGR